RDAQAGRRSARRQRGRIRPTHRRRAEEMGGSRRSGRIEEIDGGLAMPVLRFLVGLIAALAIASPAHAQSDYPNKPIRMMIGFPPGSAADVSARVLANGMSQILGQQVVVESKPG